MVHEKKLKKTFQEKKHSIFPKIIFRWSLMTLVMFLDLKNLFFDRSVHGKCDNVILECSGGESVLGWV